MSERVYLALDKYGIEGVDQDYLDFVLRMVLGAVGQANKEVGLVITSDEQIQILNKKYRGKDKPTNVLSFDCGEFDEFKDAKEIKDYLGDIYIAYPTMQREAKELGHTDKEEITRLFIHGLLHLVGYDHETDKDLKAMEELEDKIWGYIF